MGRLEIHRLLVGKSEGKLRIGDTGVDGTNSIGYYSAFRFSH